MSDFESVFLDRMELELFNKIKGEIYMKFVGNGGFRVDIHNNRFNIHFKYLTSNVYTRCMSGETTANIAVEIIKAYKRYVNKILFYTKL